MNIKEAEYENMEKELNVNRSELDVRNWLMMRLSEMKSCHERGEYLYVNTELCNNFNVYYPPDAGPENLEKKDDIYFLFIELYRELNGHEPYVCFQLGKSWLSEMKENLKKTNIETPDAFLRLFARCTSINRGRRPESVEALEAMREYRQLCGDSFLCD